MERSSHAASEDDAMLGHVGNGHEDRVAHMEPNVVPRVPSVATLTPHGYYAMNASLVTYSWAWVHRPSFLDVENCILEFDLVPFCSFHGHHQNESSASNPDIPGNDSVANATTVVSLHQTELSFSNLTTGHLDLDIQSGHKEWTFGTGLDSIRWRGIASCSDCTVVDSQNVVDMVNHYWVAVWQNLDAVSVVSTGDLNSTSRRCSN